MEQYSDIDKALAELKEKYEKPVVVEQFTNPKPAGGNKGVARIFLNQTILCIAIAAGMIASKFLFPEVFDTLYEIIITGISSTGAIW